MEELGANSQENGLTAALARRARRCLIGNYGERELALVRGDGVYVWDADGRRYLAFLSGIAVNVLGHCPRAVVEAVSRQVRTLIHVSNLYLIVPQIELAELLCGHSFEGARCFFCNSGTEANEAAIKLVRKYWYDRGEDRFEIISAEGSFHGRTLASVTATGQAKYRAGFGPLVPGFRYVPFNDVDALAEAVTERTAAVLLEPIQCEGGINIPDAGYLERVRELCDSKGGVLLVLDEVQTGNGRTGKLFAFQHTSITPDIVTVAKGLAGGLPIGAMIARTEIAASFGPGTHAATFGGNPLVCAAGVATLRELLKPGFMERVGELGRWFLELLREQVGGFSEVRDIRGQGFIVGVEVRGEPGEFVRRFRERGILVGSAGDRVVRFLPPLTAQREHIEAVVGAFRRILERC